MLAAFKVIYLKKKKILYLIGHADSDVFFTELFRSRSALNNISQRSMAHEIR